MTDKQDRITKQFLRALKDQGVTDATYVSESKKVIGAAVSSSVSMKDLEVYCSKIKDLEDTWSAFINTMATSTDQLDQEIYQDFIKKPKKTPATPKPAPATAGKQASQPVATAPIDYSQLITDVANDPKIVAEAREGPLSQLKPADLRMAVGWFVLMAVNGPEGIRKVKYQILQDAGFKNRTWKGVCLRWLQLPGIEDMLKAKFPLSPMLQSYGGFWPAIDDKLTASQTAVTKQQLEQAENKKKINEANKA